MKLLRFLYAFIAYIMFFLLVYSIILNVVSLIALCLTGEIFTVDYWELIFIPVIIAIEARFSIWYTLGF